MENVTIGQIIAIAGAIGALIGIITKIVKSYNIWLEELRKPNKQLIESLTVDVEEVKNLTLHAIKAIEGMLGDNILGEYNYFVSVNGISLLQRTDLMRRMDTYDALKFNGLDIKAMKTDLMKLPLTCGSEDKI